MRKRLVREYIQTLSQVPKAKNLLETIYGVFPQENQPGLITRFLACFGLFQPVMDLYEFSNAAHMFGWKVVCDDRLGDVHFNQKNECFIFLKTLQNGTSLYLNTKEGLTDDDIIVRYRPWS